MDGLATLKEIRKTYPKLPVIMFSAITERGAEATLDALALGATDYFTKPAGPGGIDASREVIRRELVPALKALCGFSEPRKALTPFPTKPLPGRSNEPLRLLVIGTSTGGPSALAEVFRGLPADFPLPILIVQHMPPMFTRLLAERLTSQFKIPIQEGSSGAVVQPGRGWIAPGDYHMTVVREGMQVRLLLNQDPPENSCRPAVDVTLRSVAQVYGPNSLNVVLTGMGQDGLRGCRAIREVGGQILAQDEASSVVWGMPGSVARAGLADRVLPLSMIAEEIARRAQKYRTAT
jgi:two-component system chemotaxis response regulator CheB